MDSARWFMSVLSWAMRSASSCRSSPFRPSTTMRLLRSALTTFLSASSALPLASSVVGAAHAAALASSCSKEPHSPGKSNLHITTCMPMPSTPPSPMLG